MTAREIHLPMAAAQLVVIVSLSVVALPFVVLGLALHFTSQAFMWGWDAAGDVMNWLRRDAVR